MENNLDQPPKLDLELEKLKLSAEQGAKFYTNNELPLEHEVAFIKYIKAFELAAKEKKTIKVFDYLGKPSFPPNPPDDEFSLQFKGLFDLLDKKKISITSICEVDDREMYRFIIEDLFEYDMIDLGDAHLGVSMFTYEEFYPNDQYDIEQIIRDVLRGIQNSNLDYEMLHFFNNQEKPEIKSPSKSEFKEAILKWRSLYDKLEFKELIFEVPYIIEDKAMQKVNLKIETYNFGQANVEDVQAEFKLIRDFGFWYISGLVIGGLKI